LNRGVVDNVYGIAFNPTNDEAGMLYNRSWNYAIQYPLYGYVIEGQRTFQINKTAFDRVNVRRLFLKMEKLVYRIAKRFCYEGNTPYMRQRFVDTIRPIFEEAIQGSGISEYVIICDERNNKTINIENHELHCTIAVRPVKTIEFIVMNFIAMPQSGSFSEETILSMTPYYD
jgi:phage tail sheath protein FI